MGSLYDNSGEDIYARRDIEKRRKHAMAMKKKRKRQILKRKIMLFTGAAAILVASLGLTAAVRKNNTASGSSLNPKETNFSKQCISHRIGQASRATNYASSR